MTVEWKSLLAQNEIPENQWPLNVEEVKQAQAKQADTEVSGAVVVVTYPPDIPVTIHNPESGKNEWNPLVREPLSVIYKAYKSSCGDLSAPRWSRVANAVKFYPV